MRVFTTVPQEDLRRVPATARHAEAEGYDGIISMENKHDPFLALAVPGAATERIELHTGVAISFARTPMAVAQVGWDLAGEECDGVKLHGFCTRKYLTDAIMPRLEAGLAKAGRKRENYEISGGGFLATGPDDASVAKRFEWVRQRVAFYGSTPAYFPVLAVHGLEDLGHKLHAMSREGKWGEMAKEVPDDVAHLFAAVGRHDQIVGAIETRFGGMTDALTLRGDGVGDASEIPRDLVQDIRHVPHRY